MNYSVSSEEKIRIKTQEILIPQAKISDRVEELGREISTDYKGRELHLVGVLNGAFIFLAMLYDFLLCCNIKYVHPPRAVYITGTFHIFLL